MGLIREQPERLGELRGLEAARSLLARLIPESAAVAAGRAERGAARADAAFAAMQVERAASAWRTALAEEQALQATRAERMARRFRPCPTGRMACCGPLPRRPKRDRMRRASLPRAPRTGLS